MAEQEHSGNQTPETKETRRGKKEREEGRGVGVRTTRDKSEDLPVRMRNKPSKKASVRARTRCQNPRMVREGRKRKAGTHRTSPAEGVPDLADEGKRSIREASDFGSDGKLRNKQTRKEKTDDSSGTNSEMADGVWCGGSETKRKHEVPTISEQDRWDVLAGKPRSSTERILRDKIGESDGTGVGTGSRVGKGRVQGTNAEGRVND